MHNSNKLAFLDITQFFLDVALIFLAYLLSYNITSLSVPLYDIDRYNWVLIIVIPVWILTMLTFKMYNSTMLNYYNRLLSNIVKASFFTGLVLAALMYSGKITMFSRTFFTAFIICITYLSFFGRLIYIRLLKKLDWVKKNCAIVVGSPKMYKRFSDYLDRTSINIKIVGYVGIGEKKEEKELGKIDDIENIISSMPVDEVIFALPRSYEGDIEKYVQLCETMGITARMVLDLYNLKISKTHISSVGLLPMITFHTVSLNRVQLFIKRIIDIVGAIIGLIVTVIVGIFISILIRIDSKGPVVFCQERVGLNGRKFKFYKFRSMYVDSEKKKDKLMGKNEMTGDVMFKIKNDPRVTKVGSFIRKTSLDELPQFWNVLKGDMSLVGTRPPTIDEVQKYKIKHRRRISIRPGITGLWQVSGRNKIKNFDEVVKLDTQYIDNWSILYDLKIMFKTILVLFTRKGAY